MSKYLAQYVPDQLLSMMTRLKEATIDMGPQPVRYAKFTQLPWEAVVRMCGSLAGEKGGAKGQQEAKLSGTERSKLFSGEGNQSKKARTSVGYVQCLLLTTDLAFEIWLLKPNLNMGAANQAVPANVELECVYRRKEDKVEMVDFLHMSHEVYSRPDSFYAK